MVSFAGFYTKDKPTFVVKTLIKSRLSTFVAWKTASVVLTGFDEVILEGNVKYSLANLPNYNGQP